MKNFKLLVTIIAALTSLPALADGPSSRNAAARRARQEQAARDLQAAQEAQAALERQLQEQQATIERMAQERQALLQSLTAQSEQLNIERMERERLAAEEQRAAIAENERSATATTGLTPVAPTTAPQSPLTDWNAQPRRQEIRERARSRSERISSRSNVSMIDMGAGIEQALQTAGVANPHSGWNVLLSVKTQGVLDLTGRSNVVLMHIDGRMSLDPSGSESIVPYLDVRIIPFSLNDHDRSNSSILQLDFFETQVHRDVRMDRSHRLSISVIGGSTHQRAEINDNIDFVLAAAVHVLGVRAQSTHVDLPRDGGRTIDANPRGMHVADADLALSLLFHSVDRAWGARITFGGSLNTGFAATNGVDPITTGPGRSPNRTVVNQTDLNGYAEAGLRLSRFLELYTRVSITQLRENGRSASPVTRSVTQFMTGASLQF